MPMSGELPALGSKVERRAKAWVLREAQCYV